MLEGTGSSLRSTTCGFSPLIYSNVVVGQESDKAIVRDFAAKNTCLVSAGEIAAKLVTFGELAGRGR